MDKEKNLPIAIYARVSTLLNQDPNNQIIPIKQFAESRNLKIVHEYVDRGISGSKERRPGLDQLVKDARSGKFKVLIVYSIDRLARDTRHLLNLINELSHYGVNLIKNFEKSKSKKERFNVS
jgi:DNA invertase Pin-like site-specific DNA recombinase